MTPTPIPLMCRDNAGTGFLVRRDGHVWLVTCVHLVTGLKDTPAQAGLFAGAQLEVMDGGQLVPLFDGDRQRFRVVLDPSDGILFDILALKLDPDEEQPLRARFGCYAANDLASAEEGAHVNAAGYPGAGKWLLQMSNVQTTVKAVVGISILLEAPSTPGLSGGPLTSHGGLVGIVHGDVGTPPAYVHGLAIKLAVVADQLFGPIGAAGELDAGVAS